MSEGGVRIRRKRPFTTIDNEMARDKRLSLKALGLGVRMLSWPQGKTYSIKYITKAAGVSKDTLHKLFNELIDCGYLTVTQPKGNDGRFGVNVYDLDDVPAAPWPNFPATEKPAPEKPEPDLPEPENSAAKERSNRKKESPIIPTEVLDKLTAYADGDEELLKAILGLCEMRHLDHAPLSTTRAATILTNKLDKLSGGNRAVKIAMLDKAVEHHWASVYPLKEDELAALRPTAKPARRFVGTKIIDGEEVDVYE